MSLDPNSPNSIWNASTWSSAWDTAFGKGSGPGSPDYVGGLSEQDRAFIDKLYEDYGNLPDAYEAYTGNRFADISPEEQNILNNLQGGGGYKPLFDEASSNLGLAGDVYKKNMNMTDQDIINQSDAYRNPFEQNISSSIMRDLSSALSQSNMANQSNAFQSGAGGGSRVNFANQAQNQALIRGAGDAIGNLKYRNYTDSINMARQANRDRATSATNYGNFVNQNLGIGVGGLDKDYSTKLGAFSTDRQNQQKDLDFGFEEWQTTKMFPWSKLSFGGNLIGSLPLEQKQAVPQPAGGGK